MSQSQAPLDRVFIRPQHSIFYRRTRRLRWQSEARAEYSTLLLLGGGARFESSAGGAGELHPGGALLIEPGMTTNVTGREVEYISLQLAPAYVLDCAVRTRLVGAGNSVTFRTSVVAFDERLARLARDMADELTTAEPGQEMVVAALLEQLVIHLLRQYSNVRRSDELELSRVGLVDRRIRRAVELMHAHLNRELPLEEIAAAAYLSPFHFARLFKKLTGASPHAYLATLRVERAQTLLAETDLSISDISARVGYASSSHFAKAFRQATGLTPRAFRSAIVRG
ncbi:MAG TPA: helix-turn-helix domain-containing protein [Pyrinomonadaceae bacterium]|jgi:AraC family transcriptional regulator|nr:helix-turn-helix domain-containing protein [Pyrinomonadaceae bacterium]